MKSSICERMKLKRLEGCERHRCVCGSKIKTFDKSDHLLTENKKNIQVVCHGKISSVSFSLLKRMFRDVYFQHVTDSVAGCNSF